MERHTRYQGAIVKNDRILLIRHQEHGGRSYWVIPGGGIESPEREAACVRREMKEETGLDVKVLRCLLEEPSLAGEIYRWKKTYLCEPVGEGEPAPGYEPEIEASNHYIIAEVRWFDLRDDAEWDPLLRNDPITYPMVQRLRQVLGYVDGSGM